MAAQQTTVRDPQMIRSDEQFLSLIDSFHGAAISGDWEPSLAALAAATGSRSGELIALGSGAAMPFNLMTNMPEDSNDLFLACRGSDPAVNPRVRAGSQAPILKVMAEADFLTPGEHERHPHYREFALPLDIPYICLTTLDRSHDLLVGLAVLRSGRQGHIETRQRECFGAVAPHVRAAVRTHMHLRGEGMALLAGTMEKLSMAAFVCDANGRVRNLTSAAEALVASGQGLELRQGRLLPMHDADARSLDEAIRAISGGARQVHAPALRTVVVRGPAPSDPATVIDVIALPQRGLELIGSPRVLLVARGRHHDDSHKTAILQSLYGLTAAEADIALQLVAGKPVDAIATGRGVSTGTVRLQIKTLLAKVGVSRQVELVARLGAL